MKALILSLSLMLYTGLALAQSETEAPVAAFKNIEESMTSQRLGEIVLGLDGKARIQGNYMQLTVLEVPITVIADPKSNRMRAFSPFRNLDGVDGQTMYRMMQANFDSALDARYAIAKDFLISVYVHPLSQLSKNQFIGSWRFTVCKSGSSHQGCQSNKDQRQHAYFSRVDASRDSAFFQAIFSASSFGRSCIHSLVHADCAMTYGQRSGV